jgi:hypothetical protein
MEAARTIRAAVDAVSRLRQQAAGDAALQEALTELKRLQSRRFAGTYADLLRDASFGPGARFFLEELYGDRDHAQRDAQFARIAGAIESLFPAQVARTAAALAQLHALTEDLDLQMAHAWLALGPAPEAPRYVQAWRDVGREADRRQQLNELLDIGRDLALLTRTPGLRTMLRMMRGPASASGMGALQRFLEAGFDTFSGMARRPGTAERFLDTVNQRETALFVLLFEGDDVASGTELARILGQAP